MGQGEYDCTHYIGEYMATWANDPEIRIRGQMMVEYIMADFAIDTIDGIYIGAHARTTDRQVLEKWNGLSSFFGWLFFGNTPAPAQLWRFWFRLFSRRRKLSIARSHLSHRRRPGRPLPA